MAILKVFCFWFSLRLGSIIIGTLSLIQAGIWLSLSVIWIENPDENSKTFNSLLDTLGINDGILRNAANAPQIYLTILITFFAGLTFSSVLLIIGSFQCKPKLLYPFLLLYPIYVILLIIIHVFVMICFKNEDYGLGNLILYSNLGGFLLLYLLYLWVCVISFLQIIQELRSELRERTLTSIVQKNKKWNSSISGYLGQTYKY